MDNLNLPPYFIGQKVICINRCGQWKDHITGIIREGAPFYNQEYTVSDIRKEDGVWGIKVKGVESGLMWYRAFKPIQESPFPSLTYSEVVKKESELISNN